jgi:hypothetical protein
VNTTTCSEFTAFISAEGCVRSCDEVIGVVMVAPPSTPARVSVGAAHDMHALGGGLASVATSLLFLSPARRRRVLRFFEQCSLSPSFSTLVWLLGCLLLMLLVCPVLHDACAAVTDPGDPCAHSRRFFPSHLLLAGGCLE